LKKQREIDGLKEEIHRLRQKLSYQGRKEKEGFFGSSTPSAKLPLKASSGKNGVRNLRALDQDMREQGVRGSPPRKSTE